MSALHFAARNVQIDIARLLLEAGADLAARNDEERTPLEIAVSDDARDPSRRSPPRRPTKKANDEYFEISILLIDWEREAGLLTSSRCEKLAALATKHRCPELVGELAKIANR